MLDFSDCSPKYFMINTTLYDGSGVQYAEARFDLWPAPPATPGFLQTSENFYDYTGRYLSGNYPKCNFYSAEYMVYHYGWDDGYYNISFMVQDNLSNSRVYSTEALLKMGLPNSIYVTACSKVVPTSISVHPCISFFNLFFFYKTLRL
jgi:hypothetical protein